MDEQLHLLEEELPKVMLKECDTRDRDRDLDMDLLGNVSTLAMAAKTVRPKPVAEKKTTVPVSLGYSAMAEPCAEEEEESDDECMGFNLFCDDGPAISEAISAPIQPDLPDEMELDAELQSLLADTAMEAAEEMPRLSKSLTTSRQGQFDSESGSCEDLPSMELSSVTPIAPPPAAIKRAPERISKKAAKSAPSSKGVMKKKAVRTKRGPPPKAEVTETTSSAPSIGGVVLPDGSPSHPTMAAVGSDKTLADSALTRGQRRRMKKKIPIGHPSVGGAAGFASVPHMGFGAGPLSPPTHEMHPQPAPPDMMSYYCGIAAPAPTMEYKEYDGIAHPPAPPVAPQAAGPMTDTNEGYLTMEPEPEIFKLKPGKHGSAKSITRSVVPEVMHKATVHAKVMDLKAMRSEPLHEAKAERDVVMFTAEVKADMKEENKLNLVSWRACSLPSELDEKKATLRCVRAGKAAKKAEVHARSYQADKSEATMRRAKVLKQTMQQKMEQQRQWSCRLEDKDYQVDLDETELSEPLLRESLELEEQEPQARMEYDIEDIFDTNAYKITTLSLVSVESEGYHSDLATPVMSISKGKVNFTDSLVNKIKVFQKQNGQFELSQLFVKLMQLDYQTFMDIFKEAGLHSLGSTVANDIQSLVVALLVIVRIIQHLAPSVGGHLKQILDLQEPFITKINPQLPDDLWTGVPSKFADILKPASSFVKKTNADHPLVYSNLELGQSWEEVVFKMLY